MQILKLSQYGVRLNETHYLDDKGDRLCFPLQFFFPSVLDTEHTNSKTSHGAT